MVEVKNIETSETKIYKIDYPNFTIYESLLRNLKKNPSSIIIEEGKNKYSAAEILSLSERLSGFLSMQTREG